MISIVFLSNFYTHHQHELSQELHRLADGHFWFIETSTMTNERKEQGWSIQTPEYVIPSEYVAQKRDDINKRILESDLVIWGCAPYSLIAPRLKSGKITFLYSERIYKQARWKLPFHIIKFYFKLGKYKNHFLLCASAYAATDYAKCFCFKGKSYKWGYFPPLKVHQDINSLIDKKIEASILWVGRFIDWKHPEAAVRIAKQLKDEGYSFKMKLIGIGTLLPVVQNMIFKLGLQEYVQLLEPMTPEDVRHKMEASQIFLFTSDRKEGWGAVLNEAMNSACAVVASNATGSAPYLVEHGFNGFAYQDGNIDAAYHLTKFLLDNAEIRKTVSKSAYNTITQTWNAQNAALRIVQLYKNLADNRSQHPFVCGLCSKADS